MSQPPPLHHLNAKPTTDLTKPTTRTTTTRSTKLHHKRPTTLTTPSHTLITLSHLAQPRSKINSFNYRSDGRDEGTFMSGERKTLVKGGGGAKMVVETVEVSNWWWKRVLVVGCGPLQLELKWVLMKEMCKVMVVLKVPRGCMGGVSWDSVRWVKGWWMGLVRGSGKRHETIKLVLSFY